MSTRTRRKCQLKLTVLGSQSGASPSRIEGFREFEADLSALFYHRKLLRNVPMIEQSPPGRIALRRRGIMLPEATRRRRRILQSRILSCIGL